MHSISDPDRKGSPAQQRLDSVAARFTTDEIVRLKDIWRARRRGFLKRYPRSLAMKKFLKALARDKISHELFEHLK